MEPSLGMLTDCGYLLDVGGDSLRFLCFGFGLFRVSCCVAEGHFGLPGLLVGRVDCRVDFWDTSQSLLRCGLVVIHSLIKVCRETQAT